MGDIMEYIKEFSSIIGSLGGLGFLVGVILLYKTGLLEFLLALKKNGKNGNGKELQELKEQIELMGENHLHDISIQIKELNEMMIKHNTEEIIVLRDIKNRLN